MLLSVFSGLVVLAVFFIVLGYSVRESSYNVIGFVFLFVLAVFQGGALGGGSVLIKTGVYENSTYVYGDNYSSYHWDYENPPSPSFMDVNLFHIEKSEVDVYTNLADDDSDKGFLWFMRWLAIISAIGMTVSVIEIKKSRSRSD